MVMFKSESELLAVIAQHDELVRQCVRGELEFWQFCAQYKDFYWFYALDGHESDVEERAFFEKHEDRILPHRTIAYDILGRVCSDEDAEREIYKQAGRFGSAEATVRLSHVAFPAAGSRRA